MKEIETTPVGRRIGFARTLADRATELSRDLTIPLFLSIAELMTLTGLSEASLRRMEAAGEFPHFAHLGPRRRALALHDYLEWAKERSCSGGAT